MLQEDVDLPAFVEQRADSFDLLYVESIKQLSGAKLGKNIGELQVAYQGIVGFLCGLFAVFAKTPADMSGYVREPTNINYLVDFEVITITR